MSEELENKKPLVLVKAKELPLHCEENAIYFISADGNFFDLYVTSVFGEPLKLKSFGMQTIRSNVDMNKNIFQDDKLKEAKIEGMIFLDNSPIDYISSDIAFDNVAGTLDFSAIGGLWQGQNIVITITK